MTSTETDDRRCVRPVPLRRNRRFQLMWSGSALSFLAVEVTAVGYPLAILAVDGSATRAGVFGVVQTAAMILFALPAGGAVDRYGARRVFLTAEFLHGVVAVSVAVALSTDRLSTTHLVLAAITAGGTQPFLGTARIVVVRAMVPPDQLPAALAQEEIRTSAAGLAGPPLGGLLSGLSTAFPFTAAAMASTLSWLAGFVAAPRSSGAAGERRGGRSRFWSGLATLWSDPLLRLVLAQMTLINVAAAPQPLLLVTALRGRGVEPAQVGLALAGGAIGAAVGSVLVRPLCRLLRPGTALVAVPAILVPVYGCLTMPLGAGWVCVLLAVATLGVPTLRVVVDVLVLQQVPDELRGRVAGALISVLCLGYLAGIGLATILMRHIAPRTALLVLVVVFAAGTGVLATRGVLRRAPWPDSGRDG